MYTNLLLIPKKNIGSKKYLREYQSLTLKVSNGISKHYTNLLIISKKNNLLKKYSREYRS